MTTKSYKSNYTPENVDAICKLIAETGIEGASADRVVSSASHHKWKRKYPEYKARVDEALSEFRRKRTADNVNFALLRQEYIIRCFEGKQTLTERIERITEHPDGTITKTTEIKTKQVPPPPSALVMPLDDGNSKELVIKVGLAHPDNPDDVISIDSVQAEEEEEQDKYDDFEDA